MADEQLDVQALLQSLDRARLQLETAIQHVSGPAGGAENLRRPGSALDDQNTSCQNSGCGGAEALKATAVQPGVAARG